ncbi:hypothetical protein [Streptomyces sp. NPDC056405]|uniref:hypothetical protein n=1 Tax=Streptomyces sp. NPDC056405 TaxID=3345811 RepID=UPI0035DB5D88
MQLVVIAIIVLAVLAVIVLGLRRGSLKSANFQGLGMRAGVEGGQEAKPLTDQTMQTDDFRSKRSRFRMVKGARTSFRRTRFKHSVVEILPDDGTIPPDRTRPLDPPPGQNAP